MVPIRIPFHNTHCTDLNCRNIIDDFAHHLMSSIDSSCSNCIPSSKSFRQKVIPGWNEYVKHYKDDSLFHHSIWVSAGKPQYLNSCNNDFHPLYINMKRSRNLYHYAVRRIRISSNMVKADRLSNA